MRAGRPSQTALRVAIRRAAHQLMDEPPVMHDPIAVPLLGGRYANDMERAMHPVGRDFRAFMAVRSRYVEDHLAQAVANGVTQYVILGAGLDTFAWRNPHPVLRVFEVDHPATQEWKHSIFEQAGLPIAAQGLTFVPLDFEHKALAEGLADAGFDNAKPAFFSWLGVVPYLTLDAFRSTLTTVVELPAGTGIGFDYAFPPESLSFKRRMVFNMLANRVAAAGEPFRLFFLPGKLDNELTLAGFHRIEQVGIEELNDRYFKDRADGLRLTPVGLGQSATAWV